MLVFELELILQYLLRMSACPLDINRARTVFATTLCIVMFTFHSWCTYRYIDKIQMIYPHELKLFIDRYWPPFTYGKALQCFKMFSSLWTYHILCFLTGSSASCKTESFLLHGFYYRYKVEINKTLANSWLHCKDLCARDDICRDYRYNATTGICSRNTADYGAEIVRSLTECEKLCFTEPRCRSFLFKTDIKRCYISYTNASTAASWCETCAFSLKLCAEGKIILGTTAFYFNITWYCLKSEENSRRKKLEKKN